jgi:hypothetical protein
MLNSFCSLLRTLSLVTRYLRTLSLVTRYSEHENDQEDDQQDERNRPKSDIHFASFDLLAIASDLPQRAGSETPACRRYSRDSPEHVRKEIAGTRPEGRIATVRASLA